MSFYKHRRQKSGQREFGDLDESAVAKVKKWVKLKDKSPKEGTETQGPGD